MTAEDVKNRVMEHLAKLPYVMWENQFNLVDSHDCGRLHNNPIIDLDGHRASIIFQFILTGAASIYYGDEAYVSVISTNDKDVKITLPLGVIGASAPIGNKDVFGKELEFEIIDNNHIELIVEAHKSYFFECKMK